MSITEVNKRAYEIFKSAIYSRNKFISCEWEQDGCIWFAWHYPNTDTETVYCLDRNTYVILDVFQQLVEDI